MKKIKEFFKKISSKINVALIISLLALSASANFNRINSSNSKLESLYQNSIDYLINLEKKELLFVSKNEKSVSTKQEEIQINISDEFYYAVILDSINNNNKYAKELKDILKNVTTYHSLEIERLSATYALAVEKESNFDKKYIEENEKKISKIEEQQMKLTQNNKINLRDKYKEIVISYYFEEKEINRFKLFYFF
ncbi:hypothetical protein BTU63_03030 [Streptococcus rubneri]|uniref:Chemotaxis methyl-accepting receptor HlyB-like 4HB MCP domain-containing protein n=1 Tax=Streptococcus rubneri TaxID=1234680 RepID=A0A4Z1DYQ1_9STRE|nr:hypothetical protein [Streptococcus rubneri]MBK4773899.1 hypothetical protein [Streptococcus rubneri]TGN92629.1 hypothetical protein E5S68_06845 [Streptococcus rubneri]